MLKSGFSVFVTILGNVTNTHHQYQQRWRNIYFYSAYESRKLQQHSLCPKLQKWGLKMQWFAPLLCIWRTAVEEKIRNVVRNLFSCIFLLLEKSMEEISVKTVQFCYSKHLKATLHLSLYKMRASGGACPVFAQ